MDSAVAVVVVEVDGAGSVEAAAGAGSAIAGDAVVVGGVSTTAEWAVVAVVELRGGESAQILE